MSYAYVQDERKQLLVLIETIRQEMIQIVKKEGFSSLKAVKISQELDDFILIYQTIYPFGV